MTLENLTQLQKIALEGEIAKVISIARHDYEILYRYYVLLKNSPKEMLVYLKEIFRDLVDIKQSLLDKVAMEALLDEPPIWLWINRTVADIKLAMTMACADQIGEISADKKAMQKKIMKSVFISFCRKVSIMSPTSCVQLCRHIIDEEAIELGFLEDACFTLIEQVSELPKDEKVRPEIMNMNIDLRDIMSFRMETEVLEKLSQMPLVINSPEEAEKEFEKTLEPEEGQAQVTFVNLTSDGKPVSQTFSISQDNVAEGLSAKIAEILNEQLKTKKAMKQEKWEVFKDYRGYETSLRTFNSEKEADEFISHIEAEFPELKNSCTFKKRKIN